MSLDTTPIYDSLVSQYQKGEAPLSVDFRALVDWIRVGDRLTHHLHPYPAKLLPHIAHLFCNSQTLAPAGTAVVDPFCGSGTVGLEASIAGRLPLIADANPLALLIARVKTRRYDESALEEGLVSISRRAKKIRGAPSVDIVNADLWYSNRVKGNLELILRAIRDETQGDLREFFEVCFSAAARRLSNADLTISVPVRMRLDGRHSPEAKIRISERMQWLQSVDCLAEFIRVCQANIARVRVTNTMYPNRIEAKVIGEDARALQLSRTLDEAESTKSISLVLTSPPYGSAQKYVRASSLSLNWLGLCLPIELADLESRSVGREHVHRAKSLVLERDLPPSFQSLVDEVNQENARRSRITEIYLHEYREALKEMARVVSPGGRVAVVVGNNVVCGKPLRNDIFTKEILERLGLSLELELVDTIKSRGLMTKRNRTASIISREAVLVFEKG